jgi:hypothetical protein
MQAPAQPRLDYSQLSSWPYVRSYLEQFGPLDPPTLMAVAWRALEAFEVGGYPTAAAAELPYALG